MEAVQAAASADKASWWAQPVKAFGYIVIVNAALVAVMGIVGGLIAMGEATNAGLGAIMGSVVVAAVLCLQGSVVLMRSYYVQTRAEEANSRVSALLSGGEGNE